MFKLSPTLLAIAAAATLVVAVAVGMTAKTDSARTDDPEGKITVPAQLGVACDNMPVDLPAFLAENGAENLTGDNQMIAWGWYPWAMSMLNLWEITGDSAYLENFTRQYDQVVDRRDSETGRIDGVRKRVLKAWGFDRDGTTPYTTTTGETGLIAHAGLRFAEMAPPGYEDASARYLRVGREAVAEFRDEFMFYRKGGYYHDPYRDLAEPINHAHALGLALISLNQIEGGHLREINGLAQGFRQSRWGRQGAWVWTYRLVRKPVPKKIAERTGKATTTLRFPLAAWRAGIGFRSTEVRRMARTFTRHVDTSRGLNFVIDRNKFRPLKKHVDYPKVLRFAEFDAVDKRIGNRLVRLMNEQCGRFKQGWFTNKHTVYALTELMLSRRGYRTSPRP